MSTPKKKREQRKENLELFEKQKKIELILYEENKKILNQINLKEKCKKTIVEV